MEINQDNQYDRPEEKCPKCDKSLNTGIVFINTENNCKAGHPYTYMEVGEAMHMECYIEKIIEEKWNELTKNNK